MQVKIRNFGSGSRSQIKKVSAPGPIFQTSRLRSQKFRPLVFTTVGLTPSTCDPTQPARTV